MNEQWWWKMEGPGRKDICARSFGYALRAIKMFQAIQEGDDRAGWVLGKQFLRAGTSIGAQVKESQAAESRADFVHKLSIAQKEARESRYWLRLLARSDIVPESRLLPLIQETEELLAIITAIIVNTKRKSENS